MDFLKALKALVTFSVLSAFALVRIIVGVAAAAYFGLDQYALAAVCLVGFGILTWLLERMIDYSNRHTLSRALAAVTEVRDHVVTIKKLLEEVKGG